MREEAIKSALKFLVLKQKEQGSWGYANNDNTNKVSWNEVLEWIDKQPCGDCISRQAVLDIAKSSKSNWIDNSVLFKRVNELPPVTPQPKVGRWFHREDMDYLDENKVIHNHFMCKDCGFIHDFIDGHTAQYKYCPSCGAKMEVDG